MPQLILAVILLLALTRLKAALTKIEIVLDGESGFEGFVVRTLAALLYSSFAQIKIDNRELWCLSTQPINRKMLL